MTGVADTSRSVGMGRDSGGCWLLDLVARGLMWAVMAAGVTVLAGLVVLRGDGRWGAALLRY
ncbi:hypothetical protein TanjilG_30937 [Lupinus angustifolius]|uniref:Uncharacterized protein n=1 Tax=Lupinus angustifolius TaxID=3871 RepID=A0A1J7GLR1_LUPAN|nr:hypothetical protein TanjilG_30937 [Lupinus angustifolius]